jgi:hypothetical protein
MVKKDDIDQAAELVDLGRVLTGWLFDKEKIWSNSTDNVETRDCIMAVCLSSDIQINLN